MEKQTIGTFIAVLRKAKGLTQKQLAEMLNVSDKAVSRWERDECAPDLSLIPVLAEIFDVTADELLRGQRRTKDEPETRYETQKTEKQFRHMLKKAESDYTIVCVASIAVAVIGLIAAMIGNLGFLRAYIGFFVSCVFFVAAVLCQAICLIQGLRNLDYSESDDPAIANVRRSMILWSEISFSVCGILFAACLPLITLVNDTYAGLGANSWLQYSVLYGLTAAAICLVICLIINIRLGYQALPNMKTPRNKLRLRTALILAGVVLVTMFIHRGLVFGLFRWDIERILCPGTKWETWEDLKEFLETPISPDGEEMTLIATHNNGYTTEYEYRAPDGNTYFIYDTEFVLVYESDMETPKYECIRRNLSVASFSFTLTAGNRLPIYTYDTQQYQQLNAAMNNLNICINMIYPLEIAFAFALYHVKVKKIKQAE